MLIFKIFKIGILLLSKFPTALYATCLVCFCVIFIVLCEFVFVCFVRFLCLFLAFRLKLGSWDVGIKDKKNEHKREDTRRIEQKENRRRKRREEKELQDCNKPWRSPRGIGACQARRTRERLQLGLGDRQVQRISEIISFFE